MTKKSLTHFITRPAALSYGKTIYLLNINYSPLTADNFEVT